VQSLRLKKRHSQAGKRSAAGRRNDLAREATLRIVGVAEGSSRGGYSRALGDVVTIGVVAARVGVELHAGYVPFGVLVSTELVSVSLRSIKEGLDGLHGTGRRLDESRRSISLSEEHIGL
jgi:hypothetical protein